MRVISLNAPGQFALQETNAPQLSQKDEALVRVLRVGICGTDLHAFEGTQPYFSYPRILGHELAVEVLELGENNHTIAIGDICTVEPYLNCGTCAACQRGTPNACMHLQVIGVHRDGGMQEMITLPVRKLHPANELPIEHLALVEMLSIGAHSVRRANLLAGETVLVIGAGPIGMGVMVFAHLMNANVIAMDINPTRLAFCQNVLGVEHIIHAQTDPLEQLVAITGNLPTAVFDATGNIQSMTNAFQYVMHGGRLIYVGLVNNEITFSDPHFHSRELTLLASRNATPQDFKWVVEALTSKVISLDGWVTHVVNPEQMIAQFADWLKPDSGLIKATLTF